LAAVGFPTDIFGDTDPTDSFTGTAD